MIAVRFGRDEISDYVELLRLKSLLLTNDYWVTLIIIFNEIECQCKTTRKRMPMKYICRIKCIPKWYCNFTTLVIKSNQIPSQNYRAYEARQKVKVVGNIIDLLSFVNCLEQKRKLMCDCDIVYFEIASNNTAAPVETHRKCDFRPEGMVCYWNCENLKILIVFRCDSNIYILHRLSMVRNESVRLTSRSISWWAIHDLNVQCRSLRYRLTCYITSWHARCGRFASRECVNQTEFSHFINVLIAFGAVM